MSKLFEVIRWSVLLSLSHCCCRRCSADLHSHNTQHLRTVSARSFFSFFQIGGTITNTGHSVIFTVDNDTRHHINVTGGPLSYKYQFQEIHVHYGLHDQFGSEHSINGYAFPAEVSTHKSTVFRRNTASPLQKLSKV